MQSLKQCHMLIDGACVKASDGGVFDSVDPSSGEVWARAPEATGHDVETAVLAAHRSMQEGPWASMSPSERGHCLRRLAELLEEHSEDLGRLETRDTGKLFQETRWQAKYIAEFFHFYAGAADKIHGETLPIDKPDLFVFTEREPVGVVAAIVPWNSQLFLSAVKIAPALAAGCSVVLKVSEHAPVAMLAFGELVLKAGIPPGVINLLSGHGEPCGRALTSHPLVARVSFTGGSVAAARVIANSTENFAQLSLELGGKSPFIVFDDADIESAVNGAVAGIFGASGQSCVAGSRLYLQEGIAEEFLQRMAEAAAAIRIGDPMDEESQMGPLCTFAQIEHVERQLEIALQEGARLLCGGRRLDADGKRGWFFQPTIVECPRQDMTIVDEELFAPVVAALRFRDEEEVLRLANDSNYGLAAGIFSRDSARCLRMARSIQAGIVWVNTYRVISPIAPFGGQKLSGYGRESGFQAVYDYTRPKTVWMNMSDAAMANPFQPR